MKKRKKPDGSSEIPKF